MLNLLRNSINAIKKVSGLDSDASAFITAAGLTDATQKDAINTLVKDMKASGLWSKMKAVYPMVGGTATSMKFNLKDPRDLDAAFRLTWSGGWTYSSNGATPNGTNAYADTYLIPNTNLTFNSVSLSFYSRNDFTPGANQGIGCTSNASNALPLINLGITPTKQVYSSLYSYNAPDAIISSTGQNLSGLSCVSRTSATSLNLYKNATNLATRSSNNQTTQPANAITIGAFRNVNTIQDYCSFQYGFAHIGDGLTNQEYLLLNQIVEKYQVALSRGVQAAQSFYYNSAYSNEANTYLYSTQITGTTQVSAINTLINGLKANNLWSKMKAVYPFVTDYRNLLSYTEDFTNAFWNKYGSTITANTVIAPNGTLTADTLQENTLNTEHHVKTTLNGLIPSETYTYSNYVKYNDRRYMLITVYYNGGIYPNYYATFDILNGVLVSQSGGSGATIIGSSITADNNGWYRITVSGQLGVFSNNVVVQTNLLDDSLAQVYIGTSKSAYVWGAQLEIGTSASTYQPVLAVNNYSTNVAAQMKFNLVNPQDSDAAFRLAFSGGWTYSTNGAITNLINSYADTKLNPGTVFGSGYAAFGAYWRNNFGVAQTNIIGSTDGSNRFDLGYDLGVTTPFVATGNAASTTGTDTSSKGLVVATRQNATSNKLFRNNNLIINGTLSFSANPSYNFYLGGRNNVGVAQLFNNNQEYAFAFLSTFLSDAEVAILNQLVTDYETTLNRNV